MERKLKKYLKNGKFDNVSHITSKTMSAIRGKNNRTTELALRMAFIRSRIKGFRLHVKELPGNPDFYFVKQNVAIFVDGCYWHGCPKCGHIPKTRSEFWRAKIQRNQQRDKQKTRELKKLNIKTIRIWEHELRKKFIGKTMDKINKIINIKT